MTELTTDLEFYIYDLLLEDLGETSVENLRRATQKIARYIRSRDSK